MSKEFVFAGSIAIVVFTVLAVFLLLSIILMREVPRNYVYTLTRRNKRYRILQPGTYWLLPFVDKIEHKINLQIQQARFDKLTVSTADSQQISFVPVLAYKIIDVDKYLQTGMLTQESISGIISAAVDKVVDRLSAKLVLSSRTAFNALLLEELNDKLREYGFRAESILLVGVKVSSIVTKNSSAHTGSSEDTEIFEDVEDSMAAAASVIVPLETNELLSEESGTSSLHNEVAPSFEVLLRQSVDANTQNWRLIKEISQLEQELASYDLWSDEFEGKEFPIIDQSGFTYSILEDKGLAGSKWAGITE